MRRRAIRTSACARECQGRQVRRDRDNETDYRTGKLSDQDFRTLGPPAASEAVEILRDIDSLEAPRSGATDRLHGMQAVFSTIQVIICVVLVLLILMPLGKDTRPLGAFGVGTGTGPLGGGSLSSATSPLDDLLRAAVRRQTRSCCSSTPGAARAESRPPLARGAGWRIAVPLAPAGRHQTMAAPVARPAGASGAQLAAGVTASRSTMRSASVRGSCPARRSCRPSAGGMISSRRPPTFMPWMPSTQPGITPFVSSAVLRSRCGP